MKTILRILPDVLALLGVVCIVVALWLVSPVAGLLGLGAVCVGGALLLMRYGGEDP